MRALCGLGIAILVSGCLAAQHRSGAGPVHGAIAPGGAPWNGAHFAQRYRHGAALIAVPYAYPIPYAYTDAAPPADSASADSDPAAPAPIGDSQGYGRPYAAAQPSPPPAPVHSLILNMEESDANPPAEPSHYYIALKDHQVYLAVAYWVEGSTLHYFLAGNTHNQVSLSLVDRDLIGRLNRESGVEVKLP